MLPLTPLNSPSDEAPIIRIVNTILLYAIKEEAREIWLEVPSQAQSFRVFYFLGEGQPLKEQITIPGYAWKPVEARLLEMVADDNAMDVVCQGVTYRIELSRELKSDQESGLDGDALVLKLRRRPPATNL